MKTIAIILLVILAACSDSSSDTIESEDTGPEPISAPSPIHQVETTSCANTPIAPCIVSVAEPSVAGDPVLVEYTLCCPTGTVRMSILEVSGISERNWGDVTRWAACGHRYVEEFTTLHRSGPTPYAILSVFDEDGPISECRTTNAPQPIL